MEKTNDLLKILICQGWFLIILFYEKVCLMKLGNKALIVDQILTFYIVYTIFKKSYDKRAVVG